MSERTTLSAYHRATKEIESLSNIARIPKYGERAQPEMTMERLRVLLRMVGNPQQGRRYIHVAGTSGKGSVATMIQSIIAESRQRVGLYTSPHTTTSVERITVNNVLIRPAQFVQHWQTIKPMLARMEAETPYGSPTYLEILLTIGFLHFQQQRCEWIVLEVGMGGLWDTTNIIPSPRAAVITTIDYDHVDLLGRTLKEIAAQKAGIIKKGAHVWTGERRAAIVKQLQAHTRRARAHWHGRPRFDPAYKGCISMNGDHQHNNASLAIAVSQYIKIDHVSICAGLSAARLPARLEHMQAGPTVILDGAHNPQKIMSLNTALGHIDPRRLWIILASSENKDTVGMLKNLPGAGHITFTRTFAAERRCASPGFLLRTAKTMKHLKRAQIEVDLNPWSALDTYLSRAPKNATILITGSLYLVGELRTHWISEESILKFRTSFPPTK